MKIGILTFHRAANYGAVLQAYALQHLLELDGFDAEIVDYRCTPIEQMHSPFYFLHCRGVGNKCKQLLRSPVKWKKRKLFDDFIHRRLKMSEKKAMNREDSAYFVNETYNIVITGSDQVWNPYLTGGDTTYLLDFVKEDITKISYAASYGLSHLPADYSQVYRTLLRRLDKISVREKQGQMITQELSGRESQVVLDPTLLLNASEWKTFMQPPTMSRYVLLYMIKPGSLLLDRAVKLAKEKNLPLICISDTLRKQKGIRYIPYASPEQWVGLFAEASYVVTDSFHGTAFSIIFRKAATIGLSGDKKNGNSRILDLMKLLGIEAGKEPCFDLGVATDWNRVQQCLDEFRVCSRQFLDVLEGVDRC